RVAHQAHLHARVGVDDQFLAVQGAAELLVEALLPRQRGGVHGDEPWRVHGRPLIWSAARIAALAFSFLTRRRVSERGKQHGKAAILAALQTSPTDVMAGSLQAGPC